LPSSRRLAVCQVKRMDSPGKSIAFVEQFYWPDGWGGAQIPRDLTSGLARDGWSVEMLCGSEQYS
jgi:hypothetical protein